MFVLKWIRWFAGYVTFSITGSEPQRFLSSASSRGYRLWKLTQQSETTCTACISARHYRALSPIAKKRRLRLRVVRRHGFPFLFAKWRRGKKYGLLLGVLAGIILLCALSGRVWVVDVSGNTTLSAEEIRASAAEFGLAIGMRKSGYTAASIEDQLLLRYPEIRWVSVNDWGSTVSIVLSEGERAPKVENQNDIANVTAKRSGQVVCMEIYHGKAQVKEGDGVAPGQLLVSGILEDKNGGVRFVRAEGKIMAKTRREFTASIPTKETVCEPTGEVITRRSMRVFGLTVPLTLQGSPKGSYTREIASQSVDVFGVSLPLMITTETYTGQREFVQSVSKEEARARGIDIIRAEQERILEDPLESGSILSEKVALSIKNGAYHVVSSCLCFENIGQSTPFYVE